MEPLPIDEYRGPIEKALSRHPILIITAETGAGKSTRIPLWLWQRGLRVSVTQPRRIAARSLSHYVAQTSGGAWGTGVGYQTGFDRKMSAETRLLYLTDGVQMVKEIKGQHDYDTLILDEIHEWNLNQDILVGLVRQKLDRGFFSRTGKRIIIMSATLHTGRLSSFLKDAPVIEVPGRGFPVTMHHNPPEFLLSDTMQLVEMEKNVLVFQPGKGEIDEFIRMLRGSLEEDKLRARVLPLHAELSIKEQARVFKHFDVPKVIVSTDIAQTSLTIDDIDAVVDTGIKKEVRVQKGIEGLYPTLTSRAECLQRAGRAGRVKSGQYILSAVESMKDRLPYPVPEIQRLNLESVVLRMIKWGISPVDFPYFHRPRSSLVAKAMAGLKTFGAIDEEGKITSEGRRMADLPVSIRSARMLIEAQKLSPHITASTAKLIAILETRGITSKQYHGEKYYPSSLHSDLLNQLVIWEYPRTHRHVIHPKKMVLARDIYNELHRRLGMETRERNLTSKEISAIFRVILSAFVDRAYVKTGNAYTAEGESRELEKTSILFHTRPDAVVGMPFDLLIDRENPKTGEREKISLRLITFASEISPEILDRLRPFSYKKSATVQIRGDRLVVDHAVDFGGRTVFAYQGPPDWRDDAQKKLVVSSVTDWIERNRTRLRFYRRLETMRTYWRQVEPMLLRGSARSSRTPFTFQSGWRAFLAEELEKGLNADDLKLFFDLHPGFRFFTLQELLPRHMVQRLQRMKWPRTVSLHGKQYPVEYEKNHPRIRLDHPEFESWNREDLVLPSGIRAELILAGRRVNDWDTAVDHFNRWKKQDIFEKKWKNEPKKARLQDLVDIPFPQPFQSGQDKENRPFEFFSCPRIDGDDVFLIHFFTRQAAESYFQTVEAEWRVTLQAYRKQKLDRIFQAKGWKVK